MSYESLLNDTCNIIAKGITQDPNTGAEVKNIVIAASDVPCRYEDGGENLQVGARLRVGIIKPRVWILPQVFEILKHEHIIEVRGAKYNIVSVIDLGGAKRYIELTLELTTMRD